MQQINKKVVYYAIVVAFGGFVFGLDAALISGVVSALTTEFTMSDWQVGLVVSAPSIGVLGALCVAGLISDHLGRKKTLLIIAALYLISAIGSALAPTYEWLVMARFVGGLAFASLSLSAMYIGEIAPSEVRGKLVCVNQVNIVTGLAAAYFVNYGLAALANSEITWVAAVGLDEATWRWVLGIEILPATVWLALLFTVPESPRWLAMRDRWDEAKLVLSEHVYCDADRVEQEVLEIRQGDIVAQQAAPSMFRQLKLLVSNRYRAALLVGIILAVVQPITGMNAILFYAPTIFEQVGGGENVALLQSVLVGVISIVFAVLSLATIERFGRRRILLGGLACAAFSLSLCAWAFSQASYQLPASVTGLFAEASRLSSLVGVGFDSDVSFKSALIESLGRELFLAHQNELLTSAIRVNPELVLVGILSFVASYQYAMGPVMWVMLSEIFATRVRGVAIPLCAFVTSAVAMFVPLLFPWQLANFGASSIFMSYAGFTVLGFVLILWAAPETRNRSIEQIQRELEMRQSKYHAKTQETL